MWLSGLSVSLGTKGSLVRFLPVKDKTKRMGELSSISPAWTSDPSLFKAEPWEAPGKLRNGGPRLGKLGPTVLHLGLGGAYVGQI